MFRIGQKVECVGYDGPDIGDPDPCVDALVIGAVYTVANVFVTPCGDLHLELDELPAPETEEYFAGFQAADFRPVVEKKTDISVFEEILRRESIDAPERVS